MASSKNAEKQGGQRRLAPLAQMICQLLHWHWGNGIFTSEEARIVPSLLLGVYVGKRDGQELYNKTEAAGLMGIEPGKTATKYVAFAEQSGWITIEEGIGRNGRKQQLLRPTDALRELVEKELQGMERRIGEYGYVKTDHGG